MDWFLSIVMFYVIYSINGKFEKILALLNVEETFIYSPETHKPYFLLLLILSPY